MSKTMTILAVAMVCHAANCAMCANLGDVIPPDWDDATEEHRQCVIKGVEFNLTNPNVPASGSHDSWLAQKQNDGWKYGPVKDEGKKEHPCFVPYHELPKDQQAKDHLFKGIVAALAPIVDMTPQPVEEKKPQTFGAVVAQPAAEVAPQVQEKEEVKAEPQAEAEQPIKAEAAPASEQPKPLSKSAAKKAAKLAAADEPHH